VASPARVRARIAAAGRGAQEPPAA
jgi:hypothetical protein